MSKWEEFKERYLAELKDNCEQIRLLKQELDKGTVTLVYGAKDEEHNQAIVIQENDWLLRLAKEEDQCTSADGT